MKNKKWVIGIIALILTSIICYGVYYIFVREEENSTLTIMDKQWIENNKNKIIDMGIMTNTPIFSFDGNGVIFDYLEDLETDTELEFNKTSYESSKNNTSEYSFQVVNKVGENDVLIYQDSYALVTKEEVKYYDVRDIKDLTIGVLTSDLERVGTILESGNNLKYQTFSNVEELKAALIDKNAANVDAIVIPKVENMNLLVKESKMNIAYELAGLEQNYVLRLGSNGKLNTILKKYTKRWMERNLEASFDKNFANSYYIAAEIDEKQKASFIGKRYQYGFVEMAPYDKLNHGKLNGMNAEILKKFSHVAGIEISYKEYESMGALLEDFNANQLDFFYGMNADHKYKMDVYHTVSVGAEQVAVVTPSDDYSVITSLESLKNRNVQVIGGTKTEEYLKRKGVEYKTYANILSLLDRPLEDGVIVLDFESYQFYKNNALSNYKLNYLFSLEQPYTYVVRDIKANRVFENFFNFYLSFEEEQASLYQGYHQLLEIKSTPLMTWVLCILIGAIMITLLAIYGLNRWKQYDKAKPISVPKGDKIKYIDMLTSLKNRNYLNDNIAVWDESEIYPQTIIIIDLNNISYINDNYGHEEGDKIIKEAANKLITTQIENTDIIRTNGNEFLIYMVGYDEKQVVSYIRKLNKELKDLSHGFGAAIGYSMIHDAIKTIDDAVNEATLDMKNNKEEITN